MLFLKDDDGVAVTPGIPEALMKQWENEEAVKKFRDELVEAFGTMDQPLETPSRKRGTTGGWNTEEPTRKKGRVLGPEDLCKPEELKGDEAHKVSYSGLKPCVFYVLSNNPLFFNHVGGAAKHSIYVIAPILDFPWWICGGLGERRWCCGFLKAFDVSYVFCWYYFDIVIVFTCSLSCFLHSLFKGLVPCPR